MTELIFLLFGVLIYFLRFKSQIGFEIKTQMLIFYLFTRTTMISFVFIPWLSSCFYLLLLKTFLDKNLARKRDLVHQQSLFVCLFTLAFGPFVNCNLKRGLKMELDYTEKPKRLLDIFLYFLLIKFKLEHFYWSFFPLFGNLDKRFLGDLARRYLSHLTVDCYCNWIESMSNIASYFTAFDSVKGKFSFAVQGKQRPP